MFNSVSDLRDISYLFFLSLLIIFLDFFLGTNDRSIEIVNTEINK